MAVKRKWLDENDTQLSKSENLVSRISEIENDAFDVVMDREAHSLEDWMIRHNPLVNKEDWIVRHDPLVDKELNVEKFVKPLRTLMESIIYVVSNFEKDLHLSSEDVSVFKSEGEYSMKIIRAVGSGKTKWNKFVVDTVKKWFKNHKKSIEDKDLNMFLLLVDQFYPQYNSEGSLKLLNRHPVFFRDRERKRRLDMVKQIDYLNCVKKKCRYKAESFIVSELGNVGKPMHPEDNWFRGEARKLRLKSRTTLEKFDNHPVMLFFYSDNSVEVGALIRNLRNLAAHVHKYFTEENKSVSDCAEFVNSILPGVFSVIFHVMIQQDLSKYIIGNDKYLF